MRQGFIRNLSPGWGTEILNRLASFAAPPGWLTSITPTADIYFLNAMRDLVGAEGGVTAVGPNVYGADGCFVILRYAGDAELAVLEKARPRQVFYVIDDDLEALARSAELPAGYRSRLLAFVAHSLPRILAMADVVLAPSALLLARFPKHPTELIWPSYCSVCDGFDHFAKAAPLRLVFTGSRSHAGDLELIAPALERLLAAYSHIELTTFLGASGPARLQRSARVVNRTALPWASYREHMAKTRFHVALAPFRRSATNECRSHNKLHDHAAFGAAGLYGDIAPYREVVSHGGDGLLLPPDPDAWFEALVRLIEDPASALRLAEAGASLSRRIGSQSRLRDFWCEKLGLDRR